MSLPVRQGHARAGMTLAEVAVSTALAAGLLLTGVALARSTHADAAAASRRTSLSIRAAEVADRIVRELQVAGVAGEDRNANGALDPGEDTNVNGRLDADWSLAEGATEGGLTFNVVRPGWTWSGPITLRVAGGVLLREEGGRTLELCRGVEELSFTRAGRGVDVRLVLAGADSGGERWSDFAERRVHARN